MHTYEPKMGMFWAGEEIQMIKKQTNKQTNKQTKKIETKHQEQQQQ